MTPPVIIWYRQDLRTYDLPALSAALASERPVIPCYILDDIAPGEWTPGGASRWWLHHSLVSLEEDLQALGGKLILRKGEALPVLDALARETGADTVYCSRRYEPWAREQEEALFHALDQKGVRLKRYRGSLLFEPGEILNGSGQAFKVFTPFWRSCRAAAEPPGAAAQDHRRGSWYTGNPASDRLDQWRLRPGSPNWAADWTELWSPGTGGARKRLAAFLAGPLGDYDEGRNHPAREATTRLSPHLHYGEISPREVWHAARNAQVAGIDSEVDKFLSELGWREFSHHLLYHFPHIPREPFRSQFKNFPWLGSRHHLEAWQKGQTGYPLVDAGMRELWHTGFMHNRVRMVVASFLTKHLLVPWQEGARWFWDTLVDADLANNSCGWQWVAGSGADASPFFRIFNPVTQGQKFDVDGAYIRRWLPELAALPGKYLHRPWETPESILKRAGVVLGVHYPTPIVDHREARQAALAAYGSIKR